MIKWQNREPPFIFLNHCIFYYRPERHSRNNFSLKTIAFNRFVSVETAAERKVPPHPILPYPIPMPQSFWGWMVYECLEINHLGRKSQTWSFLYRARNKVRDALWGSAVRVKHCTVSSGGSLVSLPSYSGKAAWGHTGFLSLILPNWFIPTFNYFLICTSLRSSFPSPSSCPLWHKLCTIFCFLWVLLSIMEKKKFWTAEQPSSSRVLFLIVQWFIYICYIA